MWGRGRGGEGAVDGRKEEEKGRINGPAREKKEIKQTDGLECSDRNIQTAEREETSQQKTRWGWGLGRKGSA